jgi:hypothetical protein
VLVDPELVEMELVSPQVVHTQLPLQVQQTLEAVVVVPALIRLVVPVALELS